MAFYSFQFLLFLVVVWCMFQLTPRRWQWICLLTTSYFFYASLRADYLVVSLGIVTVSSYGAALFLERFKKGIGRVIVFWLGIIVNLLVLATYKYLPTSVGHGIFLLAPASPGEFLKDTLVTIGVSYFVFQAISYLADVFLATERPERHLGFFALYLAFFPKLLQGPIERVGELLPQLRQRYEFDYDLARSGAHLFVWGLFKKIVVADRLSLYVNTVYNDVHSYTGVALVTATIMYSAQIYLDFSGYTDMALGVARLFNIRLTNNFNAPYLATSVTDFWRRWHISFSRWILDYIFKPLQFFWRDYLKAGSAAALIVTFLVSGIWHGSNWNFVAWGLLHGLYMAASLYYRPYQKKMYSALGLEKSFIRTIIQTGTTFCLVSFAWILFRANSLSDAHYVVRHLLDFTATTGSLTDQILLGMDWFQFVRAIAGILLVASGPFLYRLLNFNDRPITFRWAVYVGMAFIVIFGGVQEKTAFVYFQF